MSRARAARAAALACAAAVLLGGCARPGGTLRQQVSGWAGRTGIVGLDRTVAGDVSGLEGALRAGRNLTAKTVCDALWNDAGQAYVELPAPDAQLTNLLDTAYLALSRGANDCDLALGGSENRTLLDRALGEIHEGSSALAAADARLSSFGVASAGATGATGAP